MSEAAMLERIATQYLQPDPGRMVDRLFAEWTATRLMAWVTGPKILELGVGDGKWTGKILDRFGHTDIVDLSRTMLSQVRQRFGERVTTYEAYFETFTPPHRYDSVVGSYVLEHVEDPVVVLRQVAKWLHKEGQLIVVVPHADSLHRRLAVAMGIQERNDERGPTDHQLGHRRVYTIPLMEQHIADAGLAVRRKRGLYIKPLPQRMLAELPPQMVEGFMKLGDQMPMEYASEIAYECVLATPEDGTPSADRS